MLRRTGLPQRCLISSLFIHRTFLSYPLIGLCYNDLGPQDTNQGAQQDVENLNSHQKIRQGSGSKASNRKPTVLNDRKNISDSSNKKRKQPGSEPAATRVTRVLRGEEHQGSKNQVRAKEGSNPSDGHEKVTKKEDPPAKDTNVQPLKSVGNKRAKVSPKGGVEAEKSAGKPFTRAKRRTVYSPDEQLAAATIEGVKSARRPHSNEKGSKAAKEAAASSAVASEKDKAPPIAAPGSRQQTQTRAAGRGRNAGVIVEDLDEGKVAYLPAHRGEAATVTVAAQKEAQREEGAQTQLLKGPSQRVLLP